MSDVTYEVRGPPAWVTFDRPEAHNAMTFAMYDRSVAHCESRRRRRRRAGDGAARRRWASVRGRHRHPPVRRLRDRTRTGSSYERTIDAVLDRLEAVRKPTIALVDGFAMGSGLAISAACDLRVLTPDATFGMPIARTVGNCLSMGNYARLAQALGSARLKDVMFTARSIGPDEALAAGFATAVVDDAEAYVVDLCDRLADHSPTTLWVTKEALRRARTVPEGDDLVLEAYGSPGFRSNVTRFLTRT